MNLYGCLLSNATLLSSIATSAYRSRPSYSYRDVPEIYEVRVWLAASEYVASVGFTSTLYSVESSPGLPTTPYGERRSENSSPPTHSCRPSSPDKMLVLMLARYLRSPRHTRIYDIDPCHRRSRYGHFPRMRLQSESWNEILLLWIGGFGLIRKSLSLLRVRMTIIPHRKHIKLSDH